MDGKACFGCEYKVGWGYNEYSKTPISVDGQPDVTSETKSEWVYNVGNLSSTDIPYKEPVSLFLEPSSRKFLDYEIVFDDNKYYQVQCYFITRREGSKKFLRYPHHCSHFIKWVDHGMDLRVHFPKTGFPQSENEIKSLFEKRNFDGTQKETKCKVLINYNESKEMTLGELTQFMKEISEGKHSKDNIPITFGLEKLTQDVRKNVIKNEANFGTFLANLYCVYRKMEMKMGNAKYPNIDKDPDYEDKPFIKICIELKEAKKEYELEKEKDFLTMYPTLKKLFFSYISYIKCSVKNKSDMDEGEHLLGNPDETKAWLQKLNTWFPVEVNKNWINVVDFVVRIPPNYKQVEQALRQTTYFSDSQIVDDNEASEPYVEKENNERILFGFVNMEGTRTDQNSDGSKLLEIECLEECTTDPRRWICTKCGDYVKIKVNSELFQYLFCFCGSKRHKDQLFICYHISHRSGKNGNQSQTYNNTDLLPEIQRGLQKIKDRNEGNTPVVIHVAIEMIKSKRSEDDIKSALRNLEKVTLDRHIRHIIDLYLGKNS